MIGNGISTATTLYDVYKGYVSALSTGSTIKNVSASYLTTMTAEYIYMFLLSMLVILILENKYWGTVVIL